MPVELNEDSTHPDCSDTQLLVIENCNDHSGRNFEAVQYIPVSGSFRFLCWPVDDDMLEKYNAGRVEGTCLAGALNAFIAQSKDVQKQETWRSLSGPSAQSDAPYSCSVDAQTRSDGTITFAVRLQELHEAAAAGATIEYAEVVAAMTAAMEWELKSANGDAVDILQEALQSLSYEDGEPGVALRQLLNALVQCAGAGMSLIVGLYPREFAKGAFVLHFENLRLDAENKLKVPLLGLVHEDGASQEQAVDKPLEMYEHLQAVRASYWVASITAQGGCPLNSITIAHSACDQYVNYITKEGDDLDLVKYKHPVPKGEHSRMMLTASQIDGTYAEAVYSESRKRATNTIKQALNTGKESHALRATNIALMVVGTDPVASGRLEFIDPLHLDSSDLKKLQDVPNYFSADAVSYSAKAPRAALGALANERLYRSQSRATPFKRQRTDVLGIPRDDDPDGQTFRGL